MVQTAHSVPPLMEGHPGSEAVFMSKLKIIMIKGICAPEGSFSDIADLKLGKHNISDQKQEIRERHVKLHWFSSIFLGRKEIIYKVIAPIGESFVIQ